MVPAGLMRGVGIFSVLQNTGSDLRSSNHQRSCQGRGDRLRRPLRGGGAAIARPGLEAMLAAPSASTDFALAVKHACGNASLPEAAVRLCNQAAIMSLALSTLPCPPREPGRVLSALGHAACLAEALRAACAKGYTRILQQLLRCRRLMVALLPRAPAAELPAGSRACDLARIVRDACSPRAGGKPRRDDPAVLLLRGAAFAVSRQWRDSACREGHAGVAERLLADAEFVEVMLGAGSSCAERLGKALEQALKRGNDQLAAALLGSSRLVEAMAPYVPQLRQQALF
eukprot:XP_001698416.1 predicted protein [Chlamydomonas reinhardtii]